jgi:SAM-dependent methyltransferase
MLSGPTCALWAGHDSRVMSVLSILLIMVRRPDENWEELARTEPYYGVLTDEAFLGAAQSPDAVRRFFSTGEADAAWLLDLAVRVGGNEFRPLSALDFGCGVGRLAIPMSHRVARITGVDVAPTMIDLATRHRDAAGLANVQFCTLSEARAREERFDFVYSLIVLQHIPPAAGYELIGWLLDRVTPGGVAALHIVVSRRGGWLRRAGRQLRSRFPVVHRTMQTIRGEKLRLPYMEMNVYDLEKVRDLYRLKGFGEPVLEPTNHGGIEGVVLTAKRLID